MISIRRSALIACVLPLALILPAFAQEAAPNFASLEAAQTAANTKPGPRTIPGRAIPVPSTASPQLQAMIAAPYRVPGWNADPKGAAEWKELITSRAAGAAAIAKDVREKLGVSMEASKIGGVGVFILTPREIPPANRNRLLVHVHGWRLRLRSGRVRHRRGNPDGGVRRLQGHFDRLPHAARFPLPGRDG